MKNFAVIMFCLFATYANAALITQTDIKDSTNFFESTNFELFDGSLGTLTDVTLDIDLSLDVFDFDPSGLCTSFADCAGDITLMVNGLSGLSSISLSDAESVTDAQVDAGVTVSLSVLVTDFNLFNFADFSAPESAPDLDISVELVGNSFAPFTFLNQTGEISLTYQYDAAEVNAPATLAILVFSLIGLFVRRNK